MRLWVPIVASGPGLDQSDTHKLIIIFNEESNKFTLPTKFYEIPPTNEAYWQNLVSW